MKTTLHSLLGIALLSITFFSCQRDADLPKPENEEESISAKNDPGSNTPNNNQAPYCITPVQGRFNNPVPGGFEWVWKIVNNNPGNGSNGTFQGLSHWGFSPGTCIPGNIVSAAYSTNLTSWTYFTPSIGPDPTTQNCWPSTAPGQILKFDFGTNGSAPSYYRLVLNQSFLPNNNALAVYKSGKKTPCGTITFIGISCSAGTSGGGILQFD